MSALSEAKKRLKAAQDEVDQIEAEANREKYSTLGGLLVLLEQIVKTAGARLPIHAEGGWIGDLDSWRGSYLDAAIGFGWDGALSAIGLRNRIADAIKNAEVFEGYKGGDYTFYPTTPVRVDDHGEYTGTKGVTGFKLLEDRVELTVVDVDAA